VVMFDLQSFKVLGRIPAAEDADAIVYDGASNRVFTLNGDAHSSTVIDPKAGTLITNISLGGKPEYGASAGDGKVYANLTDTNEVVEIDAKTASVTRRWSTAPCKQPVSMAIDTSHHRLFSGCRSGVMAISDYQAAKVVATLPIGSGVDGAGFDPATGDAFARMRTALSQLFIRTRPINITSSEPYKRHRDRAIWGSTPPITVCSSFLRSLEKRPQAEGDGRCCPEHSPCW
jgi:DNA-binding beta-propeller fold protein YncE